MKLIQNGNSIILIKMKIERGKLSSCEWEQKREKEREEGERLKSRSWKMTHKKHWRNSEVSGKSEYKLMKSRMKWEFFFMLFVKMCERDVPLCISGWAVDVGFDEWKMYLYIYVSVD